MLVLIAVLFIMSAKASVPCLCDGGWGSSTPNGCTISVAAPTGFACQCYRIQSKGRDKCFADAVSCIDPQNPYCENPDTSMDSCLQAAGSNCLGYLQTTTSPTTQESIV